MIKYVARPLAQLLQYAQVPFRETLGEFGEIDRLLVQ